MHRIPLSERIKIILRRLRRAYPSAGVTLSYRTPFQLLVAVILSAQCTDKKVNETMAPYFKKYKTAADFARIPLSRLEKIVHPTGFYHSKAKAISVTAKLVRDGFKGRIPDTMEDLLTLRGVARKTANVMLGQLYAKAEGIVVDTHVKRIAFRLGLTKRTDPVNIERDLMAITPKKDWTMLPHLFIFHGRAICTARKPACGRCPISDRCPSAFTFPHFQKT